MSTGNLTHDYDLEYYYNVVPSVDPDGLNTSTTYTNGMPSNEDVDRCFISDNYIYIGDSTTVAKFRLDVSSDYGVEADININLHKAKSLLYFIYLNTTNGNPSFLYIAVALGSPNTLANIKL